MYNQAVEKPDLYTTGLDLEPTLLETVIQVTFWQPNMSRPTTTTIIVVGGYNLSGGPLSLYGQQYMTAGSHLLTLFSLTGGKASM